MNKWIRFARQYVSVIILRSLYCIMNMQECTILFKYQQDYAIKQFLESYSRHSETCY